MHGTPSLFHFSWRKVLGVRVSLATAEKYPERRKNMAMKKVWFTTLKVAVKMVEKVSGGFEGL